MLEWLHHRRWEGIYAAVLRYIDSVYEARTPTTKPASDDRLRVMYSLNAVPKDGKEHDRYDSDAISRALRGTSVEETLRALEAHTNAGFVEKLLEHICRRNLRDSAVYRAAQIDRRLFSKIILDRYYKPAKDTCVALCMALRLNMEETADLLSRAGYTLSHSNRRDVVLEYFIREEIYDLSDANAILYKLDMHTLGRG